MTLCDFFDGRLKTSNLHSTLATPGAHVSKPRGRQRPLTKSRFVPHSSHRATCSNPGTQAQLYWVDVATGTAAPLSALNGGAYLPANPDGGHPDDTVLNYEPTVNPVAGGGYAWVVFTSRRTYGNVATIPPYESDPRYFDISASPTTKKLWVSAIDLNAAPGTDPSHPAFYLPGQELLAGNSRGYWVVDPCEPNGSSCLTGEQCCGGYCTEVDGGLMCSDRPPPCSTQFDVCTQTSDCCGPAQGMQCIAGRCATSTPPPPAAARRRRIGGDLGRRAPSRAYPGL